MAERPHWYVVLGIFLCLTQCQPYSDFGTVTVLWSQPVAALQILSPSGQWKWIRHIENALVREKIFNLASILKVIRTGHQCRGRP